MNTIKAMQKYKRELEGQKTCGQNSLPSFYKKVIHRAIYGWVVFSVFCQQGNHHKEQQIPLFSALLVNFPWTSVSNPQMIMSSKHKFFMHILFESGSPGPYPNCPTWL